MGPDVLFQAVLVVLEGQVPGGVLDGKAPLMAQGVDEHDEVPGKFPVRIVTRERHHPDHLVRRPDGDAEHGCNALLEGLLGVLDALVRGHVPDHHRLPPQDLGHAFPCVYGSLVQEFFAQACARHQVQGAGLLVQEADAHRLHAEGFLDAARHDVHDVLDVQGGIDAGREVVKQFGVVVDPIKHFGGLDGHAAVFGQGALECDFVRR